MLTGVTANSAATTIQFTGVGLGNANADDILDSVVITRVP